MKLRMSVPLRNPSARTPPSMNIRMRRSSARMSYTEISPEVKPIPTTSIAGDCVRHVIAWVELGLEDKRLLAGKECIRDLFGNRVSDSKKKRERTTDWECIFHNSKSPWLLATSTLFTYVAGCRIEVAVKLGSNCMVDCNSGGQT